MPSAPTLLGMLGFATVLALIYAVAAAIGYGRLAPRLKRLLVSGLVLRVLGAVLYYALVLGVYGGGDFDLYFDEGIIYAQRFLDLDFSMFTDPWQWWHGTWWGTQFIIFIAGFVLAIIGPSKLGGFILFALLGLVGVLAFAFAFRRSYPGADWTRYLAWILFFPSLWFWPSAMGKEPVILFGLGLCVLGYVGRRGRIQWSLLGLGGFLVLAVRPQVALVVLAALVGAEWLGVGRRWTLGRTVQGALLLAVALGGLWSASQTLAMEEAGAAGVVAYMETKSSHADDKGSSVEGAGVGITSVPKALSNILFRPFPWEVGSATALIASLETTALWLVFWTRRRDVARALRGWRADRLRRFSVLFVLLYGASLGMVVVNLGIITRQRIFLFPLLFVLVEAAATARASRRVAPVPAAGASPAALALREPVPGRS